MKKFKKMSSNIPETILMSAEPQFYKCNVKLNEQVMKFNPSQSIECNPIKGMGLNSYYLNMRHELHSLGQLSLQNRREKMKRRLIADFLIEEKELNDVDLGYIETQP